MNLLANLFASIHTVLDQNVVTLCSPILTLKFPCNHVREFLHTDTCVSVCAVVLSRSRCPFFYVVGLLGCWVVVFLCCLVVLLFCCFVVLLFCGFVVLFGVSSHPNTTKPSMSFVTTHSSQDVGVLIGKGNDPWIVFGGLQAPKG